MGFTKIYSLSLLMVETIVFVRVSRMIRYTMEMNRQVYIIIEVKYYVINAQFSLELALSTTNTI